LNEIATEDVYDDILKDDGLRSWFDTHNYPVGHPLQSDANKMVIGKMKDECAGKLLVEVVGLRAKMYSLLVMDPVTNVRKSTMKAKGIRKAAMTNITHDSYKRKLFNQEENRVVIRRIGQVMHNVLTYEQRKRALCAFDDKRYLCDDRIHTLAHGKRKLMISIYVVHFVT